MLLLLRNSPSCGETHGRLFSLAIVQVIRTMIVACGPCVVGHFTNFKVNWGWVRAVLRLSSESFVFHLPIYPLVFVVGNTVHCAV